MAFTNQVMIDGVLISVKLITLPCDMLRLLWIFDHSCTNYLNAPMRSTRSCIDLGTAEQDRGHNADVCEGRKFVCVVNLSRYARQNFDFSTAIPSNILYNDGLGYFLPSRPQRRIDIGDFAPVPEQILIKHIHSRLLHMRMRQ